MRRNEVNRREGSKIREHASVSQRVRYLGVVNDLVHSSAVSAVGALNAGSHPVPVVRHVVVIRLRTVTLQ